MLAYELDSGMRGRWLLVPAALVTDSHQSDENDHYACYQQDRCDFAHAAQPNEPHAARHRLADSGVKVR